VSLGRCQGCQVAFPKPRPRQESASSAPRGDLAGATTPGISLRGVPADDHRRSPATQTCGSQPSDKARVVCVFASLRAVLGRRVGGRRDASAGAALPQKIGRNICNSPPSPAEALLAGCDSRLGPGAAGNRKGLFRLGPWLTSKTMPSRLAQAHSSRPARGSRARHQRGGRLVDQTRCIRTRAKLAFIRPSLLSSSASASGSHSVVFSFSSYSVSR
jgi:hypothetical protein